MPRPAVFLDRDGTILREVDYLRDVKQMRLLPGAASAIRDLNQTGLAVVLVTNQSGIARGLLTEAHYHALHATFLARLARYGAHLDGTYYCPHHPQAEVAQYRQECSCRKPAPGLLLRAAQELDLDLPRSWVIGDRARDLAPGRHLGCGSVLVLTGYGIQEARDWSEPWRPDYTAPHLPAAVAWLRRRSS